MYILSQNVNIMICPTNGKTTRSGSPSVQTPVLNLGTSIPVSKSIYLYCLYRRSYNPIKNNDRVGSDTILDC
jgi:hypothetical protein